jgi:hypothetical protein
MDMVELNVHNSWEVVEVKPSYAACKYHSMKVYRSTEIQLHAFTKFFFRYVAHAATVALPKATETFVQMDGALAETETKYHPNTFQNCYWFSQHICIKLFKIRSLTLVCEMCRNLLLASFDNEQRYNTVKC